MENNLRTSISAFVKEVNDLDSKQDFQIQNTYVPSKLHSLLAVSNPDDVIQPPVLQFPH